MNKYGIIIMTEYLDPATSRVDFKGNDMTACIGVNTIDQAEAAVRQLVSEGYTAFNLCSAFDQAMTERLAKAAGPGISFSYVTFTGDEQRKMSQARINGGKLGMVILDEGAGQIQSLEFEGALHCSFRFVDSLAMASRAARELLIEGATFIETCSWFDDEKTRALISTLASDTVPVGTAGRNLFCL